MRNVHGMRAFGGTFCAPIWHTFMTAALKGLPSVRFARASAPHYIWKAAWSEAASAAAAAARPKPKPPKSGGTTTSTPNPTSTPKP
jgi:membrane carboxypeptidase/penicillin-binding protein